MDYTPLHAHINARVHTPTHTLQTAQAFRKVQCSHPKSGTITPSKAPKTTGKDRFPPWNPDSLPITRPVKPPHLILQARPHPHTQLSCSPRMTQLTNTRPSQHRHGADPGRRSCVYVPWKTAPPSESVALVKVRCSTVVCSPPVASPINLITMPNRHLLPVCLCWPTPDPWDVDLAHATFPHLIIIQAMSQEPRVSFFVPSSLSPLTPSSLFAQNDT